ncbi:hypothetical protein STEG23_013749 [Scotinomys teguina]
MTGPWAWVPDFHLDTRCDSSIVKLSGDIQLVKRECRQVEKSFQELFSTLETVSKNLDVKVTQLLEKIEASTSEHTSNLKMVQGDYRHEMNLLEFKYRKFNIRILTEPQRNTNSQHNP